jgi:tetratricopeptide (TPR) repeat protein
MLRISAIVLFALILSHSAEASSRSDLKAGYAALLHREYESAIALLTSAIDAGDLGTSDQALAYHWRGAEYLKLGEDDRAIADFDRALALDPNLATAYSDRGIAYRRAGRYELAIADYGQAIRLWPNWHDWYLNRGVSYEALGRHDEAIADFTKAVFYNPRLVRGYVLRADVYAGKDDLALAAADIRRAMSIKHDALAEFPRLAEKFRRLGLVS